MRAVLAFIMAASLAACLPPLNAQTAELAWERCDGQLAPDYRLSQCSAVIEFPGTAPERRAAALVVRGAIRSNQGQYARALADFGRALRIGGESAQIYLERGIVHQARGAWDFAVRDFDYALALQPGLQPALDRLAQVQEQRLEAYRTQLAEYDRQLLEAPTNANLLNGRCWLRAVNDDSLDAALADCNASLLAAPNVANVLDSRGLVQFKRGDYAASLADYEAALRLEPDSGHYLYGRGLARLGLGLGAEGAADLAAAEAAQPGVTRLYESYHAPPPMQNSP